MKRFVEERAGDPPGNIETMDAILLSMMGKSTDGNKDGRQDDALERYHAENRRLHKARRDT